MSLHDYLDGVLKLGLIFSEVQVLYFREVVLLNLLFLGQ